MHGKESSACAYAASACGVVVGLTLSEVAIVLSIITAVGTFFVNWYYKHKDSVSLRETHRRQVFDE